MGSINSKSEKKVLLQEVEIYEPPKVIEETKFSETPKVIQDHKDNVKNHEEDSGHPAPKRPNKEDLFIKENGIIKAFKVHPEKIFSPDDLVWAGKVKLQKDMDIKGAHQRALQVSSDTELSSITNQLATGSGSDVETFSAISRWICANVSLDTSCKWDKDVAKMLREKKCDAEGMSTLLDVMCRHCNIKCKIIRGLAKGPSYYPGFRISESNISECPLLHFWNKVRLQDNWYLLDLAWAAGDYENNVFQPNFDDSHIICDPVAFGWRHLPLDTENEVTLQDQLILEPWKSVEFWTKRVVQTHFSKVLRLQPASHTEGIIRTENNKTHLIFTCPYAVSYKVKLMDMRSRSDLSDYVMSYVNNYDIHVKVHLPAMGSYWLTILGEPVYNTAGPALKPQTLFLYTVMGLSRTPQPPFPEIEGTWGASAMFNDAKFRLLKCRQAQVYADNGKAILSFVVPALHWIPLTYTITYQEDPSKDMQNFTYVERDMNILTYFIICTDKGNYKLSLTIPIMKDASSEIVHETCNFLIVCKYPCCEVMYPAYDGMWGPTKDGYKLGLTFEDPNSTKLCKDGSCVITVAKSKPVDLDYKLITTDDEEYLNSRKCVFAESMGNEIIFHIRLPDEGLFKFEVTGSPADDPNQSKIVMAYLLDVRKPYAGDLYEGMAKQSQGSLGVSSTFQELELQCNYMDNTITIESCPLIIEFTGKACFDLSIEAEVIPEGFSEEEEEVASFAMIKLRESMIFVINVSPGKAVRFTTDQDDGTSLTNHLITWGTSDDSHTENTDYSVEPVGHTHYGPEGGFASFLSVMKQHSWFVKSDNGMFAISQVLLRPLEGNEMIFELVQNGNRVKGAFYVETNGKEVKYKIQTPAAGYWRFTGSIDGVAIFSYLLLATSPCLELGFPHYKGLWGITTYGHQQGIYLGGNSQSSTLSISNGKANLDFKSQSSDISFKLINSKDGTDMSSNSVWVEYGNTSCHVTICPPIKEQFTLVVQDKQNLIGRFLLIANEPSTLRFPKVIKFFRGCRLFEPIMNPLEQNTEYYFKIKVPPAVFLELQDKYGRWKQSLPCIGGLFKGLVNVKASKSMLVVIFDRKGKETKLLEYDIT